jgi:hypothetical protein
MSRLAGLPLPAHRFEDRAAHRFEDRAAPQRPPEYGPGEACCWCTYFAAGRCTRFNWPVPTEGWCSQYEDTPEHLATFACIAERQSAGGQ